MGKKRRSIVWSVVVVTTLLFLVSRFVSWWTYAPPIDHLLAQLPEAKQIVPANDSWRLLMEAAEQERLRPAGDRPDTSVSDIMNRLTEIPDHEARLRYVNEHRDEVVAACAWEAMTLDALHKLAQYDQVFDPPQADYNPLLNFPFTDPTNAVLSQILLCELKFSESEDHGIPEIIELLSVLHKRRVNQWEQVNVLSGFLACLKIYAYLDLLIENGELSMGDAERVDDILDGARPLESFVLQFAVYDAHMWIDLVRKYDPMASPFSSKSRFGRYWDSLCFNRQLTLHDLFEQEVEVLRLLKQGRCRDAENACNRWRRELERPRVRNQTGRRILWARRSIGAVVFVPVGKIDTDEPAFHSRLKCYIESLHSQSETDEVIESR